MNIETAIESLIKYALEKELIEKEDIIFTRNKLLELFLLEDYKIEENNEIYPLEEILKAMIDYALSKGILENDTLNNRDLFDTKIMGLLTPRPSEVIKKFWELYKNSPEQATDYYYNFSQATDYIRKYRIEKDKKWKFETEYGTLDITINLSKPEKDPKDIMLQKNTVSSSYPKCLLCKENEGYKGGISHPARQNHRIIPITINNEEWGFQYSPYVYYNEHSIAFKFEHKPMKIEKNTFVKLLDFVKLFPHYFIGSNADLPIVGGSILSHDHYQGGRYNFALAKSDFEQTFEIPNYKDIKLGIIKWPMSVLRLEGKDTKRLIELSDKILNLWKNYSDETVGIYAFTEQTPHNTITPIVRKNNEYYQVDLVLRNNITSEKHPLGVFHPHNELHNIKKENIGLIEVMGLAVLPSRLKDEMEEVKAYILENKNLKENELLSKHSE
ncbi:MAG: UDP-glucose--hexose-1-phosphate uridylyltransferase, partial [Eubacteriales bacterium]|nr:UDP-glucose--hexose-1-phosphate uridylyltransferase [Eubacteriales bacterium]